MRLPTKRPVNTARRLGLSYFNRDTTIDVTVHRTMFISTTMRELLFGKEPAPFSWRDFFLHECETGNSYCLDKCIGTLTIDDIRDGAVALFSNGHHREAMKLIAYFDEPTELRRLAVVSAFFGRYDMYRGVFIREESYTNRATRVYAECMRAFLDPAHSLTSEDRLVAQQQIEARHLFDGIFLVTQYFVANNLASSEQAKELLDTRLTRMFRTLVRIGAFAHDCCAEIYHIATIAASHTLPRLTEALTSKGCDGQLRIPESAVTMLCDAITKRDTFPPLSTIVMITALCDEPDRMLAYSLRGRFDAKPTWDDPRTVMLANFKTLLGLISTDTAVNVLLPVVALVDPTGSLVIELMASEQFKPGGISIKFLQGTTTPAIVFRRLLGHPAFKLNELFFQLGMRNHLQYHRALPLFYASKWTASQGRPLGEDHKHIRSEMENALGTLHTSLLWTDPVKCKGIAKNTSEKFDALEEAQYLSLAHDTLLSEDPDLPSDVADLALSFVVGFEYA